ncbi:MAG TPA: hypothetical protein VL346_05875 [Acidobacteriaceae bacterium]|nr:hypothetical protein [Acidobacteriaceae bacterium]
MQETAVGLFDNANIADAVVDSLRAHGVPSNGIRVLTAPKDRAGDGFGTGFQREMQTMGISDRESRAYLSGLTGGSAMVFVTGNRQQTSEALTIMNEFGALELDAFANRDSGNKAVVTGAGELGTVNPEPKLPESTVTIGEHEHKYTTHASRSKTEGARIFTW